MNLYYTSGRNRLIVTSVNDLLMIDVNDPTLAQWNAEKLCCQLAEGRQIWSPGQWTRLPDCQGHLNCSHIHLSCEYYYRVLIKIL